MILQPNEKIVFQSRSCLLLKFNIVLAIFTMSLEYFGFDLDGDLGFIFVVIIFSGAGLMNELFTLRVGKAVLTNQRLIVRRPFMSKIMIPVDQIIFIEGGTIIETGLLYITMKDRVAPIKTRAHGSRQIIKLVNEMLMARQ